jgi:hypothetical protein
MIILLWVFVGMMAGSSLAVTALTIADALRSREQPAYLLELQERQPQGRRKWRLGLLVPRLVGALFLFFALIASRDSWR